MYELKLSSYLSKPNTTSMPESNKERRILTNIKAEILDDLLSEFGKLLSPADQRKHDELTQLLKKREEITTTGLGKGYAIPHTRDALIDYPKIGIITTKGTDYNSLDKNPVYIAIGMLYPRLENEHIYLQLLAICADIIKKDIFGKTIKEIKEGNDIDPQHLYNTLIAYEYEHPHIIKQIFPIGI